MISPIRKLMGLESPAPHLLRGLRVPGQNLIDHRPKLARSVSCSQPWPGTISAGSWSSVENHLQHLLGDLAVDTSLGNQAQELGEAHGGERR